MTVRSKLERYSRRGLSAIVKANVTTAIAILEAQQKLTGVPIFDIMWHKGLVLWMRKPNMMAPRDPIVTIRFLDTGMMSFYANGRTASAGHVKAKGTTSSLDFALKFGAILGL